MCRAGVEHIMSVQMDDLVKDAIRSALDKLKGSESETCHFAVRSSAEGINLNGYN